MRNEEGDVYRVDRKKIKREFLKQELLENSAVPVPSNPNAGIVRDITGFDSRDIREELDWMSKKGIVDEVVYKYLTGTYDFLEGRKAIYYSVKQCKHDEPCIDVKARGECVYNGKEQAEEGRGEEGRGEEGKQKKEEKDLTKEELNWVFEDVIKDQEEKQFEVQTLIFPKVKWDSMEKCKTWAKEHDFRTDKIDETDSSWRFRQANPDDFARLRTICLMPGRTTPMGECRVKAVGGPKKAVEIWGDEQDLVDLMLENEEEREIAKSQDSSWIYADSGKGEVISEIKRGAVLSAKNKQRLKEAIKSLETVLKEAGEVSDEEESGGEQMMTEEKIKTYIKEEVVRQIEEEFKEEEDLDNGHGEEEALDALIAFLEEEDED